MSNQPPFDTLREQMATIPVYVHEGTHVSDTEIGAGQLSALIEQAFRVPAPSWDEMSHLTFGKLARDLGRQMVARDALVRQATSTLQKLLTHDGIQHIQVDLSHDHRGGWRLKADHSFDNALAERIRACDIDGVVSGFLGDGTLIVQGASLQEVAQRFNMFTGQLYAQVARHLPLDSLQVAVPGAGRSPA